MSQRCTHLLVLRSGSRSGKQCAMLIRLTLAISVLNRVSSVERPLATCTAQRSGIKRPKELAIKNFTATSMPVAQEVHKPHTPTMGVVVVDHDALHKGITNCRADKSKARFLQPLDINTDCAVCEGTSWVFSHQPPPRRTKAMWQSQRYPACPCVATNASSFPCAG